MTSNEIFDSNMALARDSLRRTEQQLDRAIEQVTSDERKRVLIDRGTYVEATSLKSARGRVKALLKELTRYGLALPQAVITDEDMAEVLADDGYWLGGGRHGQRVWSDLYNNQGQRVAHLVGWDRGDGADIRWHIYPPKADDE